MLPDKKKKKKTNNNNDNNDNNKHLRFIDRRNVNSSRLHRLLIFYFFFNIYQKVFSDHYQVFFLYISEGIF